MNGNAAEVDGAFVDLALSTSSHDRVPLTEREQGILDLYDQLCDLRLESELLHAQQSYEQDSISDLSADEAEFQLKAAERECLVARSLYLLKNSAVEDILSANPLLEAVHGAYNTGPTERALHPLIDERDFVSMVHTNLSARYQSIMNSLTSQEAENLVSMSHNQGLIAKLLGLTDLLKEQHVDSIQDVELRSNLKIAQDDTKETKHRWRIMKSLVAAVVAGSGVDWAHDDELRDLVLDDED